jgi:hypothetical protein
MTKLYGFIKWPGFWVSTTCLFAILLIAWSTTDWTVRDCKQAAFDFGLAVLVSLLIYVLLSLWPEKKKKVALQAYLNDRYEDLRDELIPQYLWACNLPVDHDTVLSLGNQNEFKEFFKQPVNDSQDRWHLVANELENSQERFIAVLTALKRFQTELDVCVTLSAVNIEQGGFARLRLLSQALKRTREQAVLKEHEGVKHLCMFLWSLHTGWSFVDGYTNTDHVSESIRHSF